MSDAFKFHIELTPEAGRIVANLQTLPARVVNYVAAAMYRENQETVGHIQKKYLSFPSDGPATLEGLRRMSTPGFAGTLNSPKPTIDGDTVDSSIGTNITNKGFSYPRLHEFGGRVHIKGREHKVRLRTDARGNLVRQAANAHLAMFAQSSHKRAVERTGHSVDHDVDYPARAPISRGIADRKGDYTRSISAGIVEAWKSLNN